MGVKYAELTALYDKTDKTRKKLQSEVLYPYKYTVLHSLYF